MTKCPDCKEYNQERHYCPKFCDVIRSTTKEMQEFYKGEHEKLELIEQIVKQVESLHPEVAIGDREGIRKIKEVLEKGQCNDNERCYES